MMAESAVSAEPDEYEENAIKDVQDDTDELCLCTYLLLT